tara:strand:- start:7350 stop:9533 length:2184 start_codon:yes stop_codon:yes gene_type:complete
VSYTGNGSTTSFAVTFPFQGTGASAELEVIERTIATGAEATKSYSTHYTVTGGNGSTGAVVAGSAPADTVQWHIRRKTTQTQTTDYVANDPFPAETHETALDRSMMVAQEQQSDIDKSVSFPDTYTGGASSKLPEPSASKLLGWNADADALENTTGRVSSVTVSNVATSSGAPGTATASFTASTGALALGIPVGQTGMMGGVSMQYSTTTTDSDPGAGFIRLNNTSLNSATIMYVDDSDGTTDISAWVQSWDDATSGSTKGYITIAGNPNPASPMVIFKVTGAVTDASGYTKVPVSYVAGSTSMSNSAEISIAFSPSGDSDYAGLDYTFSTTTSDADPGTGVIRLNNGTLGSVTAIYIDDADANSADVSAYILSWDDSTNTADRGQVRVTKKSAPANYAIYKLSGASTDASGYVKLAVTHVDSNGSFADTDAVAIEFTRSGNAGSLSDPMTTRGDIIARDSSNATARLAVGSANTVLQSDGTDVSYGTVATAMIANNAVDETKLKDALVADFTEVTVAAGDSILLGDVSDSGNTKRDTVQGILDLASGGAWTLIGSQEASSDASLTQTGLDASTYHSFGVVFSGMHPATDDVTPQIQFGDSGGIDTGGSDYSFGTLQYDSGNGSTITRQGSTGSATIDLEGQDASTDRVGNAAGEGWSGSATLHIGSTAMFPHIHGTGFYRTAQPHPRMCLFNGSRLSQIVVDRILFKFSSGAIVSGRMSVFGIKHT